MGDVPISDSSSQRPRQSVAGPRWRWDSSSHMWRRAHTLVRRGSTSTAPAPTPAPSEPSPASCPDDSSSVVSSNVTVEDISAFDCSICYLPLKSPIFQCAVGHVVCATCHGKLAGQRQATTQQQCHMCRAPTPGGYSRCHAMEQAVDAIRAPCPHAAHGCAERPAYHDQEAHGRACAHRPCRCPGDGCGFAGSASTTLLEHFADVHGWLRSVVASSTAGGGACGVFDVRLREGFNVVVVGTTATTATEEEDRFTLVLNVEQAAPVCYTITAFCIHPSNTGTVKFKLSYYRRCVDSGSCSDYKQDLNVVCTDLSNGLPAPTSSRDHLFLVPRWSASDDITITVTVDRAHI